MANADSDDELVLSSSALDALKEFYAERDARAEQFAKLQQKAEEQHAAAGQQKLSMEAFTEDWNESQFWYSDECASFLAKQLLKDAKPDETIAVISAPSVFVQLKNILNAADPSEPKPKLVLLEHDNRFAVFPEFVFYDFAQPTKLPAHLKSSVTHFIVDPPFLSQDCQTKAAMTVQWMSKKSSSSPSTVSSSSSSSSPPTEATAAAADFKPKLIVCTGERMETLVKKLYKSFGLFTTDYDPVHARGLSNEFYCYANFKGLGWKERGDK